MAVAPLQLVRILELFQPRVDAVNAALNPMLVDSALPIDRRLRTVSQGLLDVHGGIVAAYVKVLREADYTRLKGLHRNPVSLCNLALANIARQFEIALLIAAAAPPEMWRHAQLIYHWAMASVPHDSTLPASAASMQRHLKSMLALAAAQPESFVAAEVRFLHNYLYAFASQVELNSAIPPSSDTWYWVEENREHGPTAIVRRPPPPGVRILFFSCRELGRGALEHVERLGSGESAEALGLPPEAAEPAFREALRRAAGRWVTPPRRHTQRRGTSNRVQVCTDLSALWHHQRGDGQLIADAVGVTATNWMMLNESPGGLAIMHVSGNTSGLVAGSALAVQAAENHPWNLCVVRWARSDNPEHIELGLELLAHAAEAVRLARPGADPAEAFRLPPLPALKRGETLLVRRGFFAAKEFTLVSDDSKRIQISECVPGELLLQTSSLELFEFNRDFSPSAG